MNHLQSKLAAILSSNNLSLEALAKAAGEDPKIFYIDADFENADLRAETLSNFDLSNANVLMARLNTEQLPDLPLEAQIAILRRDLENLTRDDHPIDWAMTQNNLGAALQNLGERGEREEGTARLLEEAVTAYRRALEVYTRDALPLDWAQTQNNLGSALQTLGAREEGTARLEEAVTAYRSALELYTRDDLPIGWARTQNNLGNALRNLGEREEGTARLEEAVTAYRSALEVRTRDALPFLWAQTQENLAIALTNRAAKAQDPADLIAAQEAVNGALEVYQAAGAAFYIAKATRLRDQIARQISP